MTNVKKHNRTLLFAFCLAGILMLALTLGAKTVYASVVEPSGDEYGSTDRVNIQEELDKGGTVSLVDGETYYINGSLKLYSNTELDAGTATLYCSKSIMCNIPQCAGYKAVENLTIKGGTWLNPDENGYPTSSIKLAHGNNINLINMTIRHCNAKGHSIEVVACSNVTIKDCDIAPIGSSSNLKTEEAVQLDVATRTTAYFLNSSPYNTKIGKKLQNGATCKNITIVNNKISGNRGVVANYTPKEKGKYISKLHSNIVLKNNTITSRRGEAVALFNTKGAVVTGNTIICKAPGNDSYTVGLHIVNFGKAADLKKGKVTVKNNTVKGGREALLVYSHTSSKFGKATISGNKLYCRQGKKNALKAYKEQFVKLKLSKNKTKKWNGK